LSSSNASTISSRDANELLEEQLEPELQTESRSASSSSDPIPIVQSPSDRSLSSSSTDHFVGELPSDSNHVDALDESNSYVVTAPADDDVNDDVMNGEHHEEMPIQIATVQTKTVRVEEVVIPQKDYEVG